mmetsp:Transcript_27558/g.69098  ORF Transcript_27558/g.69098 Transcript_27558/m.69098 type:complete len:101 (-) Transcript_27558:316-618(-)
MAGFAVSLFCLYSLVPRMILMSSATLLNLSLLTSDALAIIAGVFFFDLEPSLLYYLSLAITVGGLVMYNFAPTGSAVPLADEHVLLEDDADLEGPQVIDR